MGFYESEYWLNDTWGSSRRERSSGTYHPYVPDSLCEKPVSPSPLAMGAVADAASAIALLNANSPHLHGAESLARIILRSEAIASSRIEGLQVSAGKLLEYEALDELGVSHRVDGTEAAVLANIDAMQKSVGELAVKRRIEVEDICAVNESLLAGTGMQDHGGKIRTVQNWIGGNGVNPLGAAYVPPRPEYVPALMDDLVEFVNESPLHPLVVAAVAHAQLETIHPFADGNGRTGRALIHVILRRRGLAPHVVPPISLVLATDKSRYIACLSGYRADDASPSAVDGVDAWIAFFSKAAKTACVRAQEFERRLEAVEADWRASAKPRANSAADLLIGKLADNPVVSIESAARLTGRSYEAARNAVAALERAGVLRQNARNRKSNLFVAQDAIDAFTRYERSLATVEGDTTVERPKRPVPQRVKGPVPSSADALARARLDHRRG